MSSLSTISLKWLLHMSKESREYPPFTGKMKPIEEDITGQKFNMLYAEYPTTEFYDNSRIYCFRCDCGNTIFLNKNTVKRGHTKSCGCLGQVVRLRNIHEDRTCCVEDTNLANLINQKLRKNNTSGYTGVVWCKNRNKWYAQIMFQRKNYKLGYYSELSEAIQARKVGEKLLFEPAIQRNFENLSGNLQRDYLKRKVKEEMESGR